MNPEQDFLRSGSHITSRSCFWPGAAAMNRRSSDSSRSSTTNSAGWREITCKASERGESYPPGDRARPRSLPASDGETTRRSPGKTARTFMAIAGPPDAAHPGRSRALEAVSEARRRRRCDVTLVDDVALSAEPGRDLVALGNASRRWRRWMSRKSRVIEMRFFGGLSVNETAEALHVSPETVMRDWKLAEGVAPSAAPR